MLTQLDKVKQQLGGANNAIDAWLKERQQLLVQYCELAGLPPFEREQGALPGKSEIQSFCELLVDYVSAGHFEVYDKLVDEADAPAQQQAIANEVYPGITATTEDALTFNDNFADVEEDHQLQGFDLKLSNLGQQLEARFALEDRLIQSLHSSHA